MKFKPNLRWPKVRNPFSNPVSLKKVHKRLFSGKKPRKLTWRVFGKYALWTAGIFLLIIVFMFAWFAKDLPTPGKIRTLVASGSTKLVDRNGETLYFISAEDKKRILIENKDIPEVIKQATIALEDKKFYEHHGINIRSIIRALLADVTQGGKVQGGSTITQQFVKNALLTKEKTLTRKLKELVLTIEIESLFSKEEILTMYLNEIPYGGSNYGVEAAAKSYFSKSVKDLTLAEAATLAALPQAPTTLSPYGQNVDRLISRRNLALSEMAELGFITKEQAEAAQKEEPKFSPRHESITAPHFVLFVKDWLVQHFTKELNDAQLAEQKVEEGGLTVITSLDLAKQKVAEGIVTEASQGALKRAGASNAGLVTIDPKKGEIIAMVGSVDYFQDQFGAFNVTVANRQPGSSFKPVVYGASFKEKYNPAYHIFDLKTDFGNYTPDNYDGAFRGPISIRNALGNSLNIPAVKILGLIGIDKAIKTASDMGITTLTDKDRYGLSLVLGGGEVKLLELTGAYGVFANSGVLMPTTPVLKITDSKNKVLYDHSDPKDGRQVLDPQVAYQVTSILSDVEAKKPTFTRTMGVLTLNGGRPVASKTGTTDAFRDAWTIGYTPQYVTGVWAGNNDNSPMNRAGGSVAAAPIWDEFMEYLHKELPTEQFARPDGIQDITVDRLSNKLPVDGSEPIKDIFARWQVPTEKDDVHVRVRVCRENGLLADDSIPDELAEHRTYANVRSEKPDNPNWENPVRAWAQANGLSNLPPTQKCQAANVSPSISITEPTNNQSISGQFSISAAAAAPSGVRQVEFFIDNASINIDPDSPYSTSYSTNFLSEGSHKLTAVVTSNNGSTASHSINFNVQKDTTPPGNVVGFTCTPTGSGKATLTWSNPTDSDFKLVRIYVNFHPSGTPARSPIEVSKPGTSVIVSSLTPLTSYSFIAKSVDEAGNESSGVERVCFIS